MAPEWLLCSAGFFSNRPVERLAIEKFDQFRDHLAQNPRHRALHPEFPSILKNRVQ
jgi:hypothetical protein